jgi:threonylcarbamoyladenosine tRNA methylthiotransferase MtaB
MMKRKYNRELYESRIEKIRSLMPLACIAADVIVGFPGETEEDFQETSDFIAHLDISYMHVFTYSKRENTLAAKMENPVQDSVRKKRSEKLHQISDEKKRIFYEKNLGKEVSVLFESDNSNGFMHGFSENYIKVKTTYNPEWINEIKKIKLDPIDEDMTYIVSGINN